MVPVAYPNYPIPPNEQHRLRELERYGIENNIDDPHLGEILNLSTDVLEMPIGLISVVGEHEQRFVSRHGLDASGTPREMAFCSHAIAANEIMVVQDALDDERFNTNPLVLYKPGIRFYAGAPLQTATGYPLGTLCVLDREPRQWGEKQQRQLKSFSNLAMREIEWRYRSQLCPVTGLHQRKLLFELGEKEVIRSRKQGKDLSLACLDLDNFAQVNLRWGHAAGDRVLVDFCSLCQKFLNEDDLMARLYDESFALLLIDKDADTARAIGEGIRQATIGLHGIFSNSGYQLHVSGGISSLSEDDLGFTELLRRTEQALFLAKGNGRNQIASLIIE